MSELPPEPRSRLDKTLAVVPRALSSHAHIIGLLGLLGYLVLLPLLRVYTPSSQAMLIGGNWTNVTSDIGACIAAGGTLHLVAHARRQSRTAEATHRIIADLYTHHTGQVHRDAPRPEGDDSEPTV